MRGRPAATLFEIPASSERSFLSGIKGSDGEEG